MIHQVFFFNVKMVAVFGAPIGEKTRCQVLYLVCKFPTFSRRNGFDFDR